MAVVGALTTAAEVTELPTCRPIHMHDDNEWAGHKAVIRQKFIDENKTTLDVQRYMEDSHGFRASVKQYERKFREWGLRKNHTQKVFVSIHQELKRKRLTADDAEVMLDYHVLSRKRLKQGISRHVRPTLLSKWRDQPTRTGSCDNVDQSPICKLNTTVNVAVRPSLRQGKVLAPVGNIPWFMLADSISKHLSSFSQNCGPLHRDTPRSSSGPGTSEHSHQLLLTTRSEFSVRIATAMTSAMPSGKGVMALEGLFVDRQAGDFMVSAMALISGNEESLGFVVSHALYMLSNNLTERLAPNALVDLFQATEFQTFARAFSSSSLLSARAIVVQLLVTACHSHNVLLLEQLHGYGVDLNMCLPSPGRSRLTPLQCAITGWSPQDCLKFVQRLLELGADPTLCGCQLVFDAGTPYSQKPHGTSAAKECCCCPNNPMTLATVNMIVVVPILLDRGVRICRCFDIILAIEEGIDSSVIRGLLAACPDLLHTKGPGRMYWSLLEAAVAFEAFEIVDLILDERVDVGMSYSDSMDEWWSYCVKVAEDGHGLRNFYRRNLLSPLALALMQGHGDIAARFLSCDADPNLCYLDLLDVSSNEESLLTGTVCELGAEGIDILNLDDQQGGIFTPLQAAISSQSKSNVQLVLDAGAELTCKFGFQPLLLATMAGDEEIVQMLLKNGAPVDGCESFVPQSPRKLSPLACASAKGTIPIMKMLMDAGADINHCHPTGGLTPLQAAIAFKAPSESVEVLLANPAVDVWHPGSRQNGINAFAAAVSTRDHTVINRLWSHVKDSLAHAKTESGLAPYKYAHMVKHLHEPFDPSPHALGGESDLTAPTWGIEALGQILLFEKRLRTPLTHWTIADGVLEQAVRSGQIGIAWKVLQQGVRVSLSLSLNCLQDLLKSMTSAHDLESLEGYRNLIDVLAASQSSSWSNGCGAGLVASALQTYYHYKLSGTRQRRSTHLHIIFDVVRSLVRHGMDVNSGIKSRYAVPIQMAVSYHDLETVAYLIEHGADVNAYGQSDKVVSQFVMSPLQRAAYHGYIDMVEKLLWHGADLNCPPCASSLSSLSALGAACQQNEITTVRKLVATNADVNAPGNGRRESSLVIAARNGHQDIVLELIQNGADVNMAASKSSARTALQAACERGQLDIVIVLINHGADVNAAAASRYGVTALQTAAINGCFKICQILIGCGAKISAPASAYEGRTAITGAAERGRLDLVKYLLDKYDGDEDIRDICGKARWFARKEGHTIVDELLATYGLSAPKTNPVLHPEPQREDPLDTDEERSITDHIDEDDGSFYASSAEVADEGNASNDDQTITITGMADGGYERIFNEFCSIPE